MLVSQYCVRYYSIFNQVFSILFGAHDVIRFGVVQGFSRDTAWLRQECQNKKLRIALGWKTIRYNCIDSDR